MSVLITNRQNRRSLFLARVRQKAQAILDALDSPDGELSLLITDDARIAELNRRYLNRRGPTNVIAFPMREGPGCEVAPHLVGDVVVSVDTAAREAAAAGLAFEQRFDELLVHGVLHLFGYDHEQDPARAREMASAGQTLMDRLALLAPQREVALDGAGRTREFGRAIGRRINAPLIIALCGDLGCGKTVFVQGLAAGLAVPPGYTVASPSYTLVNSYPGRLTLHHADLYRIQEAAQLDTLGLEELLGDGVVAIEWAERMAAELPAAHLGLQFDPDAGDRRRVTVSAYGHGPIDLLEVVAAFQS